MALSSVQTGLVDLASALSEEAVVVDIDLTFVAQIVMFVLLFLVLRPLLFDPMVKLFEERERRIGGSKDLARELYAEADAKMAAYEEKVGVVKRAASEERDRIRQEGIKKEQAILAKVREETNALLEEGRARIAKEREQLQTELSVQSRELARDIATRVLGREVRP